MGPRREEGGVGLNDKIRSGYFEGRYPWSVQGLGTKNLIILDGLRVENTAPEGLALQGLRETYQPLILGRTIWTLGRRLRLPEGMTVPQMADDSARVIRELIPGPSVLMGMGLGGGIALEIAHRHPDLARALVLISVGPRLSTEGKELYRSVFEAARRLRWGRVHAALSRPLFRSALAGFFGGLLARMFAPDLGAPRDPWDFLVALQAELAWDGSEALERVSCPTLLLIGAEDRLYEASEAAQVASRNPKVTMETWPRMPHGLLKVDRDRVLDRVRSFLIQVEPAVEGLDL